MSTKLASRLQVQEDQKSILALTQLALLGGTQEIEYLRELAEEATHSNVKAYAQWLIGDDSALERLRPSSHNWFKNIAKYCSLSCFMKAGYDAMENMPTPDVLKKFMRIGMWPTCFQDLDTYVYDRVESSPDPFDSPNLVNRGNCGKTPSSQVIALTVLLLNEETLTELTKLGNESAYAVLQRLGEKTKHKLHHTFVHCYLLSSQRTFKPQGDALVDFLVNWAKIFGASCDLSYQMSIGTTFTDDQLKKLIQGGYFHYAHELGKRMVRLPKELRYFDQLPDGAERNENKDKTIFEIRSCWAQGVMSTAVEFLSNLTSHSLLEGTNLSHGGFIEQGDMNYIITSKLASGIQDFISSALSTLLFEREIRIYYSENPLKWAMEFSKSNIPAPKYMEAAEFVTRYPSLIKRLHL